jgi:hypothetical protein
MEGMSERAYAEASGLSRGAVQKARNTGRSARFADGSINVEASDERQAATIACVRKPKIRDQRQATLLRSLKTILASGNDTSTSALLTSTIQ